MNKNQNAEDPLQPFSLSSEKIFYKIGEVSKITGLESHVIRYWESMFPALRPKKSKSGQRIYEKKDIDLIIYIKKLQIEEGYTIEGIKRRLTNPNTQDQNNINIASELSVQEILKNIKSRLISILEGIK